MTTILQKPGSIALAGNITDILVSTTAAIDFKITKPDGSETYLEENYYPDSNDQVRIRLRDILPSFLKVNIPVSDIFEQTEAAKAFRFTVDGTTFDTTLVKGGVDANIDTATFLKTNWLTWQPQQKRVKYMDAEWLSYFAVEAVSVKVKAYFKEGNPQIITLASLTAGKQYSLNMNYGYLSEKFVGQPVYFDVWTENSGAVRLAFVQRYVLQVDYNEFDDCFVFENTLGSFDTVRFTGKNEENNNFEIESALFDENTTDFDIDFERIYKKNTGYFADDHSRRWSNEFFNSLQRYLVTENGLKAITVSKPKAKSIKGELSDYDFQYALSQQTKYLNLSRTDQLPDVVQIVDPESALFFLAPKLNEFPSASLVDHLTIPVQIPFIDEWKQVTYAAIKSDLLTQVASMGYVPAGEVGNHVDLSTYARKDQNNHFVGQTINGPLVVNGPITQNGEHYITHAQHVEVESNLMQLNKGEAGSQITGVIPGTSIPFSGIEINRGTPDPYYLGVVEGINPLIKLGKKSSLVTLAAREDSPLNNGVMLWDDANHRMKAVAAAPDSDKLGNRVAADYYHKDNANKNDVDWNANVLQSNYLRATTELRVDRASLGGEAYMLIGSNQNEWGVTDARMYFRSATARIQHVNGFRIFSNAQTNSGGLWLPSTGVNLTWANYRIYNAGNSNKSDVDWTAEDVNIYNELKFHGGYKIQSYNGQTLKINPLGNNVDIFGGKFTVKADGTKTTGDATISGYLGSPAYASGFGGSGWRTDATGNMTVDSLTVRKTMNVYELNINKIRSGNGSYWFSDGAKIKGVSRNETNKYYAITLDEETGNPFRSGDIIRCQVWTGTGIKYYAYTVGWISPTSALFTVYDNSHTGTDIPEIGDEIVRIGNYTDTNRQGAIYITSNDDNAPYIDVLDGVTSDSFVGKTKVRLGKLNGISDAELGGALTGYGLYSENVFLKGEIVAKTGKIANWTIDGDFIYSGARYANTTGVGGLELRGGQYKRLISHYEGSYVMQYQYASNAWGISGYVKNIGTVFQLGSTNQIAGWTFTNNKLYSGAEYGGSTAGLELLSGANQRVLVHKNSTNYVSMFYGQHNSWGIEGRNDNSIVFKLGSTNQIAGWSFDVNRFYSGKIEMYKDGTIWHTDNKWRLNPDGSGRLANGAISWNSLGVVSFTSAVSLNWTSGINTAQTRADSAYTLADSKITSSQATTITNNTVTTTYIKSHLLSTNKLTADHINASTLVADIVTATNVNAVDINASSITTGILSASLIDVDNLYVKHLQGATGDFSGQVTSTSGAIGGFNIANDSLGYVTAAGNGTRIYSKIGKIELSYPSDAGITLKKGHATQGTISTRSATGLNITAANTLELNATNVAINGMKVVHGSFYSNTDGDQSVTIPGLTNVRVCHANMGDNNRTVIQVGVPSSGNVIKVNRDDSHSNGTIYYVAYGW